MKTETQAAATAGIQTVVVTDVRIPFWSMVIIMVKFAIASIPAAIILIAIWFAAGAVLGGIGAGMNSMSQRMAERADAIARQPDPVSRQPDPVTTQPYVGRPLSGPTDSEKRCAAAGGDLQACLAAEQRCAGNPQLQKCLADERAIAQRSAEDRAARAKALDAERAENMKQVQ